jgi:hypothetical protein
LESVEAGRERRLPDPGGHRFVDPLTHPSRIAIQGEGNASSRVGSWKSATHLISRVDEPAGSVRNLLEAL